MPSKIRKKALITNQIVRVHRLDCDFLHMQQSQVFLRQGPYFIGFLIIIFFLLEEGSLLQIISLQNLLADIV